jgi:DNA-binding GntR family transcriptional regulator
MATETSATFSASIVTTLKERILSWQYPPEHRLTEDGLCREFGVSRSPVREALHVLATNGFVRRMDNRGYAVRQVKVGELEELYDVRLALELFAVERLAMSGAPADQLEALAESWRAVRRQPPPDVEDLAKLDAQFHEGLARLAGNTQLLQELQQINERLLVFRTIDFAKQDRVESTCVQHLAILDRIAAGDVAGARAALRSNIEDGRNIVGNSVKEALARAYACT